MRITSQMLSVSEQKLGLSVSRRSLLSYINDGKNSNSLLNALRPSQRGFSDILNKAKYEKLGKLAEELETRVKKLADSKEEDNLFAEAEKSKDTSKLCSETEKMVEDYNNLVGMMGKNSGALNNFYRQNLKDIAVHDEELLKSVGISVEKDGTLALDKDKLYAASLDDLKKAVGPDSDFTAKLSYLASKIADNAEANVKSYSTGYLPNGDITSDSWSKYDFRG